jgi:lactoylglutathione lyase
MLLVYLLQTLLVTFYSIRPAQACALHARQVADSTNATTYPIAIPGDDVPSDPATTGYFINHLCINARNATESIRWYSEAFGLRLMFRLQVTEHFSISYMGHSHGGRNGTGYQSSQEMNRDKNNREGMIEITSLENPNWDLPSGIRVPNTFSHIGLVVPNITATQERMDAIGATILKRTGEPYKVVGPFADGQGFTQAGDSISKEEIAVIDAIMAESNKPLLFVADPDGTVIEIQSQEGSALT